MGNAANIRVYADRRWPAHTGIGKVQTELETRRPDGIDLVDLKVPGKIGSPASPLMVTMSLLRRAGFGGGVFFSAGFIPPLLSVQPAVVIVHDLTHRHFYGAFKRFYYDWVLKFLYRRCRAIICVSGYGKDEFVEWSGIDPQKVHVVLNGCEDHFRPDGERYDPGFRYVLYCGNHRPYKNLERLIRAYAVSSLPGRNIRLLLTGNRNTALADLAESLSVDGHVVFAGRVPDEEIPKLYCGATAVAYISLFEGFGLPILEGFASGVPVMTSNVSAMPEVAADAALIVDPYSLDDIRNGLDRIVSDDALRTTLVERAHRRLKAFDWNKSARELWKIVADMA